MPKVKLRLLNIGKYFDETTPAFGIRVGKNRRTWIVMRGNILDGEAVALLGPSGCGKTTLLRLIAGFFAPDQGTILMDDVEISSPSRSIPPNHRNMSMVFQSYALWPNRTMFENVAYGLRVRRTAAAELAEKVHHALDMVQMRSFASGRIESMVNEVLHLVGMTGRECCYPAELSGGQQQR